MTPLDDEQHRMIWDNIGLVHSVAIDLQPWRQPEDDVIQAGVVGLIGAIQSFDPRFGCEFSTHAYHRIRAAIMRSEAKSRMIYVPFKDKRNDAERYKINAKQARRIKSLAGFKRDPLASRNDGLPDLDHERVLKALRLLPPRDRAIIEDAVIKDETLVSIAARLGVTKQAVSQAKKKAFGKLREMLADYAEAG